MQSACFSLCELDHTGNDRILFFFSIIKRIRVNGPIRPINMTIHSNTLPISLSSAVMPTDNPTVPKAENTSTAKANSGRFSEIVNKNSEPITTKILNVVIAKDRISTSILMDSAKKMRLWDTSYIMNRSKNNDHKCRQFNARGCRSTSTTYEH